MICPFCGKEMAEGTLPTLRDPIQWEEKDGEKTTWGEPKRVKLAVGGILNPVTAAAYYCESCRKVIVEVPEYESTLDKLDKRVNAFLSRRNEQREARQTQREEEQKEKRREKRRKNDPWED